MNKADQIYLTNYGNLRENLVMARFLLIDNHVTLGIVNVLETIENLILSSILNQTTGYTWFSAESVGVHRRCTQLDVVQPSPVKHQQDGAALVCHCSPSAPTATICSQDWAVWHHSIQDGAWPWYFHWRWPQHAVLRSADCRRFLCRLALAA